MRTEVKVATSNANESVNAAKVASVNLNNLNKMEKNEYKTIEELGDLGKDLGLKPTAVKANINGENVRIIVAHTEYGMRHDKYLLSVDYQYYTL